MTVSTTIIKNSYSGDASTTVFAYQFKISADADIQVIIRSSAGVETVKTLTTHYTVSGAGTASGGNVTFESGHVPTATETVILRRATTKTQTVDLVENDPFTAESVEGAFDKNLSLIQELQEELNRSFKVSRTNTISSSEFTDNATTRASRALGFDSSGDLTTIADYLPVGGDSALMQYSTTTTDADPTGGFIRFNHATIASATIIYVDDLDYNATDISAWVQSWDDNTTNYTNRGRIKVAKAGTFGTWAVFNITTAVTDASGYSKATLVYVDGAGSFADEDKVWVTFIANGIDGASPGYFYKFDTGTSDADPGAGDVSFNHATYANVTEIYIDDADQHGATTQTETITWDDSTANHKGILQFTDINDRSTYARFKISGAAADASGYNKLTVTHLISNNTFSAGDSLSVNFTVSGNDGAIPGYEYAFDTTTTDADPGAGDIRFNDATYADVTEIYIDDDDSNGVTTQADTATWGASTSTIKGYLHIVDTNDPATYARFKITAAVTDASGYNKITVVHLASNNTFSAADNLSVHFTGVGLKGDTGSTGSTGSTGATGPAADVLSDTSPQLGGNLDTNSSNILIDDAHFIGDESGNEQLVFQTTGSAVNYAELTNAATGNDVGLASTGSDTNVGLAISTKGTGQVTIDAITTHGSNVVSDTDSTDDLGTTSVRWANLFVDAITATDQITATGFTGTLDGILGSGAAAAATTTTLASTTITASGIVTANAKLDLNGTELILDADADTSITADTDDTIDIRISGADDFQFTANSFNALSGSSVVVDSGATLTLNGTAGVGIVGKQTMWIPSAAMYPSTTNPCSDLTQVETTALRPDLKVLDFATGADEFAQFSIAFPKSWNEGTLTFQPFWTVTGTNTGTVAWQLGGIAVSSDDTINTAFGTLVATTALAHSGTSNDLMMSAESGAVTVAGSPAANDVCFFQINRDISADDQSGDARLLGIKLFFTNDALTDA
tara:strand:+ start:887 stop:3793 length:2907 start_codon:yes stop_codon:yes gene_type:complete